MVKGCDISVVVQGPLLTETIECLSSIRRLLPEAEIIFSTWRGVNTNDLPVDKLVISEMPEAYSQKLRKNVPNNLNRLIRSTKAGVSVAERAYILKIRSDLILDNTQFLVTYEKFCARGPRRIFSHRILVPTIFSRVSYRGVSTPFHISDWAAFGRREDIQAFFLHVTEVKEPEFTQYFLKENKRSPFGSVLVRMTPEQYITWMAFRNHFDDVNMVDCASVTPEIEKASDEFIVSNFIIAPYQDTGWRVPKYPQSVNEELEGRSFFELWTRYWYEIKYKNICEKNHIITDKCAERVFHHQEIYKAVFRLKKHWWQILHSKSKKKKIEQVLEIPFIVTYELISIFFLLVKRRFFI